MGVPGRPDPDPPAAVYLTGEAPVATPFLLLALSYLLGATPTSHWMGRGVFGVDLRTEGSGNLGATNTYRVLGWKAALPVVLVDILKGWGPAALFPIFVPGAGFGWTLAFGGAAIAGHIWSFWVGFRGGKGVATSTGVFLAVAPWAILIAAAVWILVVLATGYVSLGSVLGAAVLPVALLLTPHRGGVGPVVFAAVLTAFVIWTHRSNLRRLARGEESRFGKHGSPGNRSRVPASGDPARGDRS